MNIAVKSDIHTGVPKYFTQALNLKANFNTASSKCMPKRMKVCIRDAALLYIQLEMILHCARLNISAGSSQNVRFRV